MTPVKGRNVRSMFLTSCLAFTFGLKVLVFSQLYRAPVRKKFFQIIPIALETQCNCKSADSYCSSITAHKLMVRLIKIYN